MIFQAREGIVAQRGVESEMEAGLGEGSRSQGRGSKSFTGDLLSLPTRIS
jgi:hypothetical protein